MESFEIIQEIINIAVASSKIKEIKLPHRKIRPNIHLFMYGSIGSGKSAILQEVCAKTKSPITIGLTKANIMGSVDSKTGTLTTPAIWDSRNKILGIDEFFLSSKDYIGKDVVNTLLTLMENPIYTKKMSYRCNDDNSRKDGDLYCTVKNNTISVKTRFTLFLNTMMDVTNNRTITREIVALKSRCICIPYYPSKEDLYAMLDGKFNFKFKDLKVKSESIRITKPQLDAIVSFVTKEEMPIQNFLRSVGDLCRIFAVTGKINEEIFHTICEWSKVSSVEDQRNY